MIGDIVLLVGAVTSVIGTLIAVFRARTDKKLGISSDERQARREEADDHRDTLANRDAFIDRLNDRLNASEAREAAIQTRYDTLERRYRRLQDYTDELEHHIYTRKGPPPPPRPEGT